MAFVTRSRRPSVPDLTRDLPYGPEDLQWVANSATLVYGTDDAVLVADRRYALAEATAEGLWLQVSALLLELGVLGGERRQSRRAARLRGRVLRSRG